MSILTSSRSLEIAAFLEQYGWASAIPQFFDADFSPRRYARLTRPDGTTAILMDADSDQKTPQFFAVAKILRHCGVNAPEIYAAAPHQGLVLMQDFGTRNVGALLDAGANIKSYLWRATEILAHLHQYFASAASFDLPAYASDYFVPQAELFLDAYIPYVKGRDTTDQERQDFCAAWRSVLHPLEIMPKSLMLRDFMPDNLMELPDGKLGVLDFQEAGIGPIAYDLASLCEEVRRDGASILMPDLIAHYTDITQSPLSQADLLHGCSVLWAQRHTRMLGNVARTAVKRGQQTRLLPYLPRIQKQLYAVLTAPCLTPVRTWMQKFEES